MAVSSFIRKVVYSLGYLCLALYLCIGNAAYAALPIANSQRVITKVGNPSGLVPANDNLLQTAENLFQAYGCNQESTTVSPALSQCLTQKLLDDGYPKQLVDQVAQFNNLVNDFEAYSGNVECIQFVRQAIILSYGGQDPNLIGANGNTPYNWSSMDNNGHILVNLGHTTPQPGDIAINPGGNPDDRDTTFGHISIVKSVGAIYFTAVESNFRTGYATDDISTHPIEDYVFFRER